MTIKKLAVVGEGQTATAAKLALVTMPKDQGARVMLDVEALPPDIQSQVRKFYHELNTSLGDFGRAGLKVGKVLLEARTLLQTFGDLDCLPQSSSGIECEDGG
jgi:hypothetical protein